MQIFEASQRAAETLSVDPAVGLLDEAVERSRTKNGDNRLPEAPTRSIVQMALASLNDKTLFVLIGAAFLALGVEWGQTRLDTNYEPHYIDGLAILAAVLIASFVTTLNEARAAKQFKLLSKAREDIAVKVLRNGHVGHVSIFDLVVGDVVYFDTGDKLPADGVLYSGVDVAIDQSTLTGESMPVHKDEGDLELKGGTAVSAGNGVMLVQAVGAQTEIGQLQLTLTHSEEGPTPLQERLGKLADRIGLFGFGAAVATFLALSGMFLLRAEGPLSFDLAMVRELLSFGIIAVTIVVVAVPEGLPLAVTISLAYSVRKMAKENNLVRKLASCETMGAATVVCSDKTGTLTKNRMSVVAADFGGRLVEDPSAKSAIDDASRRRFSDIAAVNSTAFIELGEGGVVDYVGNPTECALLALLHAWGIDWKRLRNEAPIARQWGFTSDRKRMSTLVRDGEGAQLWVKGAPEVVLERSQQVWDGTKARLLTEADRDGILKRVNAFSGLGHRTLALAYRPVEAAPEPEADTLEEGFVWLAVVAIADPVRPEVKDAVASCRKAGVDVKVVTGDNRLTAETIAKQIDLLGPDDLVMDGQAFREASDADLEDKIGRLRVLARSVPSDKHRLVSLLKARGEVVAVTGDGTNDAPAMHAADVGFAMGQTGTEVAKEAADIILLDDNFASIVNGILWGRSIFENIRKFLQFQLTVNVVALSTAFLAALFGLGIPLNTVQLLWVNLIMDTMAALALATEPPDRRMFDQPPHGRHAPLITRAMWFHIGAMGILMVGLLMTALWTDLFVSALTTPAERLTFVFNAFVLMQVFNEVNARSTRFDQTPFRHLLQSPLFLMVIGVTLGCQILIVQWGGAFFRTVPLGLDLWIRSVTLGLLILGAGFLVRALGRILISESTD